MARRQPAPHKVDYNERLHAVYHAGNVLSPATARLWMATLARYLGERSERTLLDLGSGTGLFSIELARASAGRVYGVEPSSKMRAAAEQHSSHPRVSYLGGAAEAIPLPNGCCDAVLLSRVIHHITDRDACARELARVLKPGGLVFIRSAFRDQPHTGPLYDYFPTAKQVDSTRFPSVDEVSRDFARHGFTLVALESVEEEAAPNLEAYCTRLKQRALSKFDFIPEEEFQKGIRAMEMAAAQNAASGPVTERYALLVLCGPV